MYHNDSNVYPTQPVFFDTYHNPINLVILKILVQTKTWHGTQAILQTEIDNL